MLLHDKSSCPKLSFAKFNLTLNLGWTELCNMFSFLLFFKGYKTLTWVWRNYSIVYTKWVLWVQNKDIVRNRSMTFAATVHFSGIFETNSWFSVGCKYRKRKCVRLCVCVSDLRHMEWRQHVSIYNTLHSRYEHICHILL